MTIVGEAELDIRAVGSKFVPDLNRVAVPGMQRLGSEGERSAARTGHAFSLMWNATSGAAMGAFSPVTQIVDHIQAVSEDLRSKSRAMQVTAAGAAGIGIGAGLQVFGANEQASQAQLRTSIEATGGVYEDFAKRIDATVKTGEQFGLMGYKTMDVLNQLTVATNSPVKAIENFDRVLNLAATRHISVTSAAHALTMAWNGNSRALKSLGIDMAGQQKLLTAVGTARTAHSKAVAADQKAQARLSDEEQRIAAARKGHAATASELASAEASVASAEASAQAAEFRHGGESLASAAARDRLSAAETRLNELRGKGAQTTSLSVSEEIALRHAHEDADAAQKALQKSTDALTAARKNATGAAVGYQAVNDAIDKKTSGQWKASVDNFTGRLHHLGAEVEDEVSAFGNKYGPAVTAVSTAVTAAGAAMNIAAAIANRYGAAGRMTAAANREMAATQEVQTAAAAASTEAEVALAGATRTLAEANVALGESSGVAAASIRAEGAAAVGTAAEMRALTVAEGTASIAAGGLLTKLGGIAKYGLIAGFINEGGVNDRMSKYLKDHPDVAAKFGVTPPGNTGPHQGFGLSDFASGRSDLKPDFALRGLTGSEHVTHAYLNDMRSSLRTIAQLLATTPRETATRIRRNQTDVRFLPEGLRQ